MPAQEQARLESQKLNTKFQEEEQREVSSIEDEARQDIKALKEKARHRLDKAVEFLIQKIET